MERGIGNPTRREVEVLQVAQPALAEVFVTSEMVDTNQGASCSAWPGDVKGRWEAVGLSFGWMQKGARL